MYISFQKLIQHYQIFATFQNESHLQAADIIEHITLRIIGLQVM